MGLEFELKFRATPAQQQALLEECVGESRTIAMETTYYDTTARELSARRITLRRRMENGLGVCTLKTPGERAARGEWDCLCETIEEAIPELCKLSGWAELLPLTAGGVVPVCGARFTRQAVDVEAPGFTAELALDRGVLLSGGRETELCEIELELKSGDPDAMTAYMMALAARYGLVPEPKSKFRRALALAEGE